MILREIQVMNRIIKLIVSKNLNLMKLKEN